MSEKKEVESPCIGVCTMDDVSGLCMGCFRTLDEIERWWDKSPDEQQNIVDQAAQRQMDQADFD